MSRLLADAMSAFWKEKSGDRLQVKYLDPLGLKVGMG
jgi:hypothetical protein